MTCRHTTEEMKMNKFRKPLIVNHCARNGKNVLTLRMLLIGISVKVPTGAAATAAAAGTASTAGACNQRRTALFMAQSRYQLQSSSVGKASTEDMLSLA